MATTREIMAADMELVLGDPDVVAESFALEGTTYTGIITRDGSAGIGHYDSFANERCDIVVSTAVPLPELVTGMSVEFNSDQWLVDNVVPAPGALVIKLSRNVA